MVYGTHFTRATTFRDKLATITFTGVHNDGQNLFISIYTARHKHRNKHVLTDLFKVMHHFILHLETRIIFT